MSRLTRIELFHVNIPLVSPFYPSWIPGYPQTHNRFTLIRLTTDDGHVGVAAGMAFTTERAGLGDLLGGFLLGIDPLDIATVRQRIKEAGYLGWRNWWIEPAFWDLKGKIEGKPVYKLLRPDAPTIERVPCYASSGEIRPFERRKPWLDDIRHKGFRALKLRVHSFDENEDFEILRRVREEVGADFPIAVDANQGWLVSLVDPAPAWDLERATRFGRVCDELGIAWIEEPLDMHDLDGYAELRRRVKTPIAGGELYTSRQEMRAALDHDAFDIFQPDATFAGGLEDGRWIIDECHARGLRYSPHTWTNGVGFLENLQLKAICRQDLPLEYPYDPPGWVPGARDGLLRRPIEVDADGCVAVPPSPGLGIEIDDEKLRRYAKRFHVMTPARLAVKTIREKGLRTALELRRKKQG